MFSQKGVSLQLVLVPKTVWHFISVDMVQRTSLCSQIPGEGLVTQWSRSYTHIVSPDPFQIWEGSGTRLIHILY